MTQDEATIGELHRKTQDKVTIGELHRKINKLCNQINDLQGEQIEQGNSLARIEQRIEEVSKRTIENQENCKELKKEQIKQGKWLYGIYLVATVLAGIIGYVVKYLF